MLSRSRKVQRVAIADEPYLTSEQHMLAAEEELSESYTGGTVEVCIRHSTRATAHALLALYQQNDERMK